jgi:hypothetical protein
MRLRVFGDDVSELDGVIIGELSPLHVDRRAFRLVRGRS